MEKLGLCGMWALMEMHQKLGNSARIFYISESRRQICCIQLNKEVGLPDLGRRSLWGAVAGFSHPGKLCLILILPV